MKILIVDDSSIIRKAIQKYLEQYKLEVVGEAGDGRTAIEMFQEKKPELVTMDITMPEMDGLSALEEMLKLDNSARILVISALSDQATALKALKLGAKGFVGKPFTEDKLKEAFDRLMEGA